MFIWHYIAIILLIIARYYYNDYSLFCLHHNQIDSMFMSCSSVNLVSLDISVTFLAATYLITTYNIENIGWTRIFNCRFSIDLLDLVAWTLINWLFILRNIVAFKGVSSIFFFTLYDLNIFMMVFNGIEGFWR